MRAHCSGKIVSRSSDLKSPKLTASPRGLTLAEARTDRGGNILSADRDRLASPTGTETGGLINTWNYSLNGGPTIDGQRLDFVAASQPWQACSRNNAAPADSAVITVTYTYRGRTPLRMLIPFFNQFTMTDRTVMAMNANR